MKSKFKSLQVSSDGGAATGKSTGAKIISKIQSTILIVGLLYRYASFLIIKYEPKNQISFLKKKLVS